MKRIDFYIGLVVVLCFLVFTQNSTSNKEVFLKQQLAQVKKENATLLILQGENLKKQTEIKVKLTKVKKKEEYLIGKVYRRELKIKNYERELKNIANINYTNDSLAKLRANIRYEPFE